MINTYLFLYVPYKPQFTAEDAPYCTLTNIQYIHKDWKYHRIKQQILQIITLGIASFFQTEMTSEKELNHRICLFQLQTQKYCESASKIQKWLYRIHYKSASALSTALRKAPVSSGAFTTGCNLVKTWCKEGKIDLHSGARGQIIWTRTKELSERLKNKASLFSSMHIAILLRSI